MSTTQPTLATTKPAPRWDLDSVFSGGSRSKEFRDFLDRIHNDLTKLNGEARTLPAKINELTIRQVADFILEFQRVALHLGLARSFAHCLMSQDVKDQSAFGLVSEADTLHASWLNVKTQLESWSLTQSDEAWERLVTLPDIAPIRFYLDELRELAREKMPPEQEALALELAVNGYHAWSRLYDKISGEIGVDFEERGKLSKLSIGQLANKFQRPDRDIRRHAFQLFEQAWGKEANLCAAALNAQAGFRLTVYKRRGWKTTVHEPLRMNRIQEGTLEAMWSAVTESLPLVEKYVSAKKRLLGIDSFCWYDQFAPVGKLDLHLGFDEAVDFIVRQLATFSEEMAQFTRMAVEKRWIEAEDRPGKSDGAFCTGFNLKRESRILMTYSGDVDAMITLAHELGHAYHQWVLRDTPYLVSEYPMGLAETASIFNELKVTGAALREAKDREGRLLLLDQTLQQPLVLFCNIRARYLFDQWFYEERSKGSVSRERLDELMTKAQKEAFGSILDTTEGLHPLFWASKLHFYYTEVPFYNFPYTFGYLFALGVYDRAVKEGKSFALEYRALLEDTGRMTAEEVARRHLGVDLTKNDFWEDAVRQSLRSLDEFVSLVGHG